jgi:hypothetical protein
MSLKTESGIMKKKTIAILSGILIALLVFSFFLLKPAFTYLSGYLSKSEKVKANVLIVEGWLPDYALRLAADEYKNKGYDYIVTTGIKSTFEYFGICSDGFLIFYPRSIFAGNNEKRLHTIDVLAYSELGGSNMAHFNLFINDSVIANYYAGKRKEKYRYNWNGQLSKLDSVIVNFDNDSWGDFGDRNLFVKEIIIDDKTIIPYMNNSAFAESRLTNKHLILTSFSSNAESARNSLIYLGIDSTKIIATFGEKVKINRTLTTALAFRKWLSTTNIEIKGINIFSMGTHARRTWMTYNKILDEKYQIGVISVPDSIHHSKEIKILKTMRETVGILYYWIILIPY